MIRINQIKEEFKKIAWLNKQDVTKQTIIVMIVVIIIGIIITFADFGIQGFLDQIVQLKK